MYSFLLHFHSGLRWLILATAVFAIFKSIIALFSHSKYTKFDNILAASFLGTLHLQLLTGLILYLYLSPWTNALTFNMSDPEIRFWSVEHLAIMLLAVIAAQVGRSISKKKNEVSVKFRLQAIFFGISLLLMLLGIPWSRI